MIDFSKLKGDQIITYIFLFFAIITPGLFYFYFEAYDSFEKLETTKILLISFLYGLPVLLLSIIKCGLDPIFYKEIEDIEKNDKDADSLMRVLFQASLEATGGILAGVILYQIVKWTVYSNPFGGIRFFIYSGLLLFLIFRLISAQKKTIKKFTEFHPITKWLIIIVLAVLIGFNMVNAMNKPNSFMFYFGIGISYIFFLIFIYANQKTKMKYLNELKKLKLPTNEYAIFGSGLLAINNLRENSDIDLIISKKLWDQLLKTKKYDFNKKTEELKLSKNISGYLNWKNSPVKNQTLISRAILIQGFPFVKYKYVKLWKEKRGKNKDKIDLKLLKMFYEQ